MQFQLLKNENVSLSEVSHALSLAAAPTDAASRLRTIDERFALSSLQLQLHQSLASKTIQLVF